MKEKHNAKSEEVEILLNDLEVSNERASSAEREILMLKERMEELKKESLAKIRDDKDKLDAADEESFENPNLARELSAKEREVQQLMSDIQKMKQEKQDEARELDGKKLTHVNS